LLCRKAYPLNMNSKVLFTYGTNQCCGAESRGVEIKLPPGVGSENYELWLQLRILSIYHRLEEIL
jgi:hypothetical protein